MTNALRGLLDRLEGSPDEGFLGDLLARAALHRPVLVDVADAAAATRPYAWLLDRVGDDGITLTSAGHLPPAVVAETMAALDWAEDWPGKHNREYHTIPVLTLRESAQRYGLLRKNRGRLLRTAAGRQLAGDPTRLWWHLASRLPEGREDHAKDAGALMLVAVAAAQPCGGVTELDGLLARGLASLGWADATTRRPIDGWAVFQLARPTWETLVRVGAVPRWSFDRHDTTPPPAGVLFARAALRGDGVTATARGTTPAG